MDSFRKYHKELIKDSKSILKAQQEFRSEKHNVFIEEINKIALGSNDDKITQSVNSIETRYVRQKKINVTIY